MNRFSNTRLLSELINAEDSPENSSDSPRSAVSADAKITSTSTFTSTSRRSRRGSIQKRVVSIPIKDVQGLKMKGDHMSAPPSDSWAWRKYGQKPIKGSPFPRGYYRCSSSKGCPARKQVERSRVDPSMLVVTYSCEHNHPWPASRHINNNTPGDSQHKSTSSAVASSSGFTKTTASASEEDEEENELEDDQEEKKPVVNPSDQSKEIAATPEEKFGNLCEGVHNGEFGWFSEFDSTFCTVVESSISTEGKITTDTEIASMFAMREEDESLFADLGELPECSTVFSRGTAVNEAEQRRHSSDETMCLPQICLPS